LYGQAPAEMLVVPVPLHRTRHAQRGFNQARALGRHALAELKKSHPAWRLTLAPSTLIRLRATETQTGLSPRQRRLNVRGAFQVADAGQVRGRHVLLIDDILTTGATARAASQTLKRAGAASVWVATLARAQRLVHQHGPTPPHDDAGVATRVELRGAASETIALQGGLKAPASTGNEGSYSSFRGQ
jgi:hypothetical protein